MAGRHCDTFNNLFVLQQLASGVTVNKAENTMVKKILISFLFVLASIIIYYTIVIIQARDQTPEIVHRALRSGRMKLTLHDLTKAQLDALLKVQDPNFYHHKGFDLSTPGAGVTTISQALVKMYYFEDFKPGIQKIEQTLLSRFAFDNLIPKDTILTLFINDVYLGEDHGRELKGFENAANYYMGKPFRDLTWDEYLSILAMIRAPSAFHYQKNKAANAERVSRIKKMLSGEYHPRDNSDWQYDRK